MTNQKRRTVLLVEDEPAICQLCRASLDRTRFELHVAANGLEAQQKLCQSAYDLVLIDVRTPYMDGERLFHHIVEAYPDLVPRVIFTTGDLVDDDTQRFLRQAGRPMLAKPFVPQELRAIVNDTLRQADDE